MTEKTLCIKFSTPILINENLEIDMTKPSYINENYYLFNGLYDGNEISVLVLSNIDKNVEIFYKLSTQINALVNLNITGLAKLHGLIIQEDKFCLVFERLNVLANVISNKTEKEKFSNLIEIMELLVRLNENKIRVNELMPASIFFNEMDEIRFMYPFGKFILIKMI
jgi:hypothetical protein